MKNRRRFLVTGGAGFLGINLIRYLLKHGCRVRSLDIAPFAYPEANKVEVFAGDIRDRVVMSKAVAGIDVIVHCAAALPLYQEKDIYTTDVDGTKNVLAAAKFAEVDRVIFISSTAVYGIPDHHPLVESDRLVGVGPYGEAKILAEQACLAARKNGLCVTILRPKTFVGPERLGVFAMLYDWAASGKSFPVLGSGNNRYQLLDVEDLCSFIYLCSQKEKKLVNDVFNVGAANFTTMKKDFQAILDEADYGGKIISIPAAPAILGLKLLEKLGISPLYQWIYETAGKDSYVSIAKAESIGYRPRYSNKQALVRNYHWYLKNLKQFADASGISHRAPWSQGILELAKIFF